MKSAALLKQKSIPTIEELSNSAQIQVIASTDGSSDCDLDETGAGIYFIHPIVEFKSYRIPTSKFSFNFSCKLLALKGAFHKYQLRVPVEVES
ncbi:hypothetical protein TNCT_668291 [Trichonephila clavata]|uniref:Uncharacterized protein n=1 Tax=Trichonephila clavata TaxID=2740835 RepID=A0A8X6LWC3_TRICU|nr:hypothetical protein TNCT_668291 [Trichonephila clavata]